MAGVRLGGASGPSPVALTPDPSTSEVRGAKTASVDDFSRTRGAVEKAAPSKRWPRAMAGVLMSTLAVGVFATLVGCQSPDSKGAPVAPVDVVEVVPAETGTPGHLPSAPADRGFSPTGDVESLPQPPKAQTVKPLTPQRLSPSGDFEALPMPPPSR